MKKNKMPGTKKNQMTNDVPMSTGARMSNYEMETKMDSEMDRMDSEMDELDDCRDEIDDCKDEIDDCK